MSILGVFWTNCHGYRGTAHLLCLNWSILYDTAYTTHTTPYYTYYTTLYYTTLYNNALTTVCH